jgi:pimeloyl-ACP methyl ester carboxylesterase
MKVPYAPTETLFMGELKKTEESIRNYQEAYYVQWKPAYEEYVQVPYRQTLSGDYPRLAKVSALTSQMIYQEPVVHELPLVKAKTLLVIGQEDRTAPGKNRADATAQKTLGNYPALGRAAARAIPGARLVLLDGVGHIPHFEAPERFHTDLLRFLSE